MGQVITMSQKTRPPCLQLIHQGEGDTGVRVLIGALGTCPPLKEARRRKE
jgi:hypothetical protein